MGLDSVEIVLSWEDSLGMSIPGEDTETLLTPRQAIDYLSMRLGAQSISSKPCLSQRAFYIIRRTLVKQFSVCRSEVRPESYLRNLLPDNGRRKVWKLFIDKLGFGKISGILGSSIFGAVSTTVNDLTKL